MKRSLYFALALTWLFASPGIRANDDDQPHDDHRDGGFVPHFNFTIDLSKIGKKKKPEDEPPPNGSRPPPNNDTPHASTGDDPHGSTYDEKLYPQVVDIHPVQVVQDPPHEVRNEDIPLIQSKKTMVRVFVKLPQGMARSGAECKLTWNGEEVGAIKGELVLDKAEGRTLVFADDEKSTNKTLNFIKALARANPKDLKIIERNSDYFWAFNFTFEDGKLMPEHLTLKADLWVNGALVSSMTEDDQKHKQFKIKPFKFHDGCFHLTVGAYCVKADLSFIANYKRFHPNATERDISHALAAQLIRRAKGFKEELLAVFPIPEEQVQFMIRDWLDPDAEMRARMVVVGVPGFGGPWRLLSGGDPVTGPFPDAVDGDARVPIWQTKRTYSALIREMYPESDAIVLVTTKGFPVAGSDISVEGWTPNGVEGVHYIDELYDPPNELSVVHEIGHQTRFLGTFHWFSTFTAHPVTLDDLQDGWNAGQHIHDDMNTAMHSYDLMADGKTEGRRRFIALGEYKKMCKVMVKGGADPLLLDLNGALSPDGKIVLAPLHLTMGYAPDKETGPGVLVFTDAAGKNLGTWNFPIVKPEVAPTWQQFETQAPVPDKTASVTLQLPGGFVQKFDVPATQPTITWNAVQYDAAKAMLHATFTVKGDAAQTYLSTFAYESDSHGTFDLPEAQTQLAPGEHAINISLDNVPQSDHAKIKLTISKDLAFAQSTSAEFALPNHPPQAYIDPTVTGDRIADAKIQGLHAVVYDLEDQFNLTTAWSEATLVLGTGADLSLQELRKLGEGHHDIVLTATDSDGNKSTDHLLLTINHDGDIQFVQPLQSHTRVWIALALGLAVLLVSLALLRLKRR